MTEPGYCRKCDVFVGYGALGVAKPPDEHAEDRAWLGSHCWVCGRSREEIAGEPVTDGGCLTKWEPEPFTLDSLYDAFMKACTYAWDNNHGTVPAVTLPDGVLDGLSEIRNPITHETVKITRVPMFPVASS